MHADQTITFQSYSDLHCMKKNLNVAVEGHAIMLILSAWPNVFKIMIIIVFIRVNYINHILQRTYTHNIYLQTHTHIYI